MKLIHRFLRWLRSLFRSPRSADGAIADTRAAIAATEAQIESTHQQLDALSRSLDALAVALDELEDSVQPVPPPVDSINPADIMVHASADVPFADQSGYTVQVIKKYINADDVPENGVHGTTLPDGSTLRFGKVPDPKQSARKAFACVVKNSDPETSNGFRTELACAKNIEQEKTYWVAVSAFVYDWGTLDSDDDALFACQCHQGNDDLVVGGPSFGLYTTQTGRTMRMQARYSTASNPNTDNSTSVKFAEHDIPFGRWIDFVLKVRHSTKGTGLMKAWMDGISLADHAGNLGYNTAGYKYYMKFGYYNWSDSNMGSSVRKVLLREPLLVRDPTGDTYTEEQLRAFLKTQPQAASMGRR